MFYNAIRALHAAHDPCSPELASDTGVRIRTWELDPIDCISYYIYTKNRYTVHRNVHMNSV
jgi:hypothetical protein